MGTYGRRSNVNSAIKYSLSALDVTVELLGVKLGGGLTERVKWDNKPQARVRSFGASEISLH